MLPVSPKNFIEAKIKYKKTIIGNKIIIWKNIIVVIFNIKK